MRAIIYGVGAVGGVVAAALARSGQEVIGIARGAMLDAIQTDGLRLRAPEHDFVARFDCVAHPSEIHFHPDDMILLTMKTQDCGAALHTLFAAGVRDQPIFCLQNGIANERMALRHFPNVHGVTVMLPATYLTPGEVGVHVTPCFGMFDVGRYPTGTDAADQIFTEAMEAANIKAFASAKVMESKLGKLRMNLGNIVQAALPIGQSAPDIVKLLQAEFDAVAAKAGLKWIDVSDDERRMEFIQPGEIAGFTRIGGSTSQSIARGATSIETDYLNGEVVLMGRLHDIPTPLNEKTKHVADAVLRAGGKRGVFSSEALFAALVGGKRTVSNNE